MFKSVYLTAAALFFLQFSLYAQEKYLIYFKDKGPNEIQILNKMNSDISYAEELIGTESIRRRLKEKGIVEIDYSDVPITAEYINKLRKKGITIINKLKWFNAVSCYLTEKEIKEIGKENYVLKIEKVKTIRFKNTFKNKINDNLNKSAKVFYYDYNYGNSYNQLILSKIPLLHKLGIIGTGVRVGMLDTGFDWERHESLKNSTIIAEYDFVNRDGKTANEPGDPYTQHNHGTYCFSIIGGYDNGELIGAAFGASFVLAKTENVSSETQVEEDNYAAALEWMDSLGVDITSGSLGYSEFDDFSYSYSDMDGKTTICTRAAEIAFSKGMLIVASAGNEGNSPWRYITAPADGFNVIAVGSVDNANRISGFSSRGPSADGRIKPDVVAQGSNVYGAIASTTNNYSFLSGTSAAAPIVSGTAALLLSAYPHLTNKQLRSILLYSSDNSSNPNNDRGYGLISAIKALCWPNIERNYNEIILHKAFDPNYKLAENSVRFMYSIDGENYFEQTMSFENEFFYKTQFPNLVNGNRIDFYFVFVDSLGVERREPSNSGVYVNYSGSPLISAGDSYIPKIYYKIEQNYPNPFNAGTKIKFYANPGDNATIIIYDAMGRKVRTLFNQSVFDYETIVEWNGGNDNGGQCASGIYYYSFRCGNVYNVRKMAYVK